MNKKVKVINGKEYTYISLDERIEFLCSRCNKNKIAKKFAEYDDNGTKKIVCNGCYGEICAKSK